MAASPALSLGQKVDIFFGFLQAAFSTFLVGLAAPFRGSNTPKTLKRHLLLTVTRKALDRLSTEQLHYAAGTTESNYISWTKSKQIPSQSIDVPGINTKAFWFGDPNSKNVVLYIHGGGWAMPGSDGHFSFVTSALVEIKRAGKSVSVLFLQYDLAPGGQYPRQLTQAVELLRYATNELGKSPRHIMMMGDSSGANLILGVLSHLLHPNPAIKPLKLAEPLRAALISSPVTILNTKNPRFITQEVQDPASARTINTWMRNYLGPSKPDPWTEPLGNDANWWSGLGDVVEELLMTVASVEMMAEDTIALANRIQSVFEGFTLFSSAIDFHAQPAIGPSLGMEQGEAADLMISWICKRFE